MCVFEREGGRAVFYLGQGPYFMKHLIETDLSGEWLRRVEVRPLLCEGRQECVVLCVRYAQYSPTVY